jgi:ribosomal protein S27AE
MAEENENKACIFPKCPRCGNGYLLPFSFKEDVFEKWKCSNEECEYTVRKQGR